jgi:small subunit ribosomal protein S21
MLIIKIGKNENINQALKRFKNKFRDTQIIKELKKRKEFIKPSSLKRKKKQDAIKKEKFLNQLEK